MMDPKKLTGKIPYQLQGLNLMNPTSQCISNSLFESANSIIVKLSKRKESGCSLGVINYCFPFSLFFMLLTISIPVLLVYIIILQLHIVDKRSFECN